MLGIDSLSDPYKIQMITSTTISLKTIYATAIQNPALRFIPEKGPFQLFGICYFLAFL